MSININKKRCPQNHSCPAVRICPTQALAQRGYAAPSVDNSKCIDCGRCSRICPYGVFTTS
jgi:Fe-S-cluster-containing hydrogenase component 2